MKSAAKIFLILFVLLTGHAGFVQADNLSQFRLDKKIQDADSQQPTEIISTRYSLDLARELVLFGIGVTTLFGGNIIIGSMDPLTEEEINALDPMDVNKFDRGAIGMPRDTLAGDGLLFLSFFLPTTFLTYGDTRKDFGTLGIMALEVLLLQAGINRLAKSIGRIRPYVYEPEAPLDKKKEKNAKLSFYSGHTSTTAAMSFYVAKVFSEYLTNKTTKIIIWTGAALYPALTGFLRRDSAKHFRTDVIVGYCVGALIGYFIPILHKTKNKKLSLTPVVSFDQIRLALKYNF